MSRFSLSLARCCGSSRRVAWIAFGLLAIPAGLLLQSFAIVPPENDARTLYAAEKGAAGAPTSTSTAAASAPFTLQAGDHICIIGNTLAERMQHHGWLETLIQARFGHAKLVIRNLGYSGDEVGGYTANPDFHKRLRSRDFGTADQWLSGSAPIPQPTKLNANAPVLQNRFARTETKADVIFAFFGANESHAGKAGVAKFQQDLRSFVEHARSQKYNGKSAPRIVLFSPTAIEFLNDPNLPSREEIAKQNLARQTYTLAMRDVVMQLVADKIDVTFVDLYQPTATQFQSGRGPYTINGIHLNEQGDKLVAEIIDAALFGPAKATSPGKIDAIRKAVLAKNFTWYQRYRATDGYSVFGDRAFLRFNDGQSNYEVGQRELEVLDVMTSNRDRLIWAAASDDVTKRIEAEKLPEFIPVPTNKPGPLPGGKHSFLTGKAAIEKMTVHKGMKVTLFASEEKFPELVNPVQMAFDTRGRLWVAAWRTYPHWRPDEPMDDKLLILEDTNGDGEADICKTFAGDLHNPTGFEFWNGGVIVAQGPDVLFLKDTDGDDKYDVKERIIHGLDTADTHHTANSFTLDPGGAMYFQEGTFHHSQTETPWGPTRRVANGAVFRYEPRSQKFDVYVTYGFANPHGHIFEKWGQDIVVDGTGAVPYHGLLFSSRLEYPQKHGRTPTVYKQRTRPCPAIEILSSSHFPESHRGNLLVGNVIGFQGILQYKLTSRGSSLGAEEVEPIVVSSDPNFRPADIEVAPDGSIYFTDWQNPIIGHMQHNLRDPNRDQKHGRVYRVTYEGRPLVKPAPIAGASTEALLDRLADVDDRVRHLARIEISGRKTEDVIAAVRKRIDLMLKQPSDAKPDPRHLRDHYLLELLWVFQQHNVVDVPHLERMLTSPNGWARAAAVRVLAAWHDRVPNALERVKRAAADSVPRVRLHALWAASFFHVPEAMEVLLIARDLPRDEFLDHLDKEVARTLQPLVDEAIRDKRPIAFTTPAGARYVLGQLSNDQLLKQPRTVAVYQELLYRPGLQDEHRREAIQGLSRLTNRPELDVILDAIRLLDARGDNVPVGVVFDLVRQLTSRPAAELSRAREAISQLVTTARTPIFRHIGIVSLISIDRSVEPAWKWATTNARSLEDFVLSVPLIPDASVRASLYDRIEPLLQHLPDSINRPENRHAVGRYVRIELAGKRTLSLAEVEVFSGGKNIARQGRASQKNTSHGGTASKAIDGNRSGAFADGGQTHSEENTSNPYWEVDLGAEHPLEKVVIYNRTDSNLGERLQNFSLVILDADRKEVFRKVGNPAPKSHVEIPLPGMGREASVRRAAMTALTSIRGQEGKAFAAIAPFVRSPSDRTSAVQSLQRIPKSLWPKDAAVPLAEVLLTALKQTPVKERTSAEALQAMEFAESLASLLPTDQGKKLRLELREIGVRVIRVGTVFEKMSYDKDILVVRAGRPVEFLLENSDLMPHNFVILQPGSLEETGLLAEASAQRADFAARGFVPASPKVLAASKLLQPRDSQRLSFQVPTKPGVYPYVCTYPGHWRRMYGALYVVEDLEAYEAAPEKYLASSKIEPVDALLKDRRPRTEWKFDDLATAIRELDESSHGGHGHEGHAHAGRNYGNGKQLFTVANCVACHKLDGVGQPIGPDLTKLEAKYTVPEILKEILDPSAKINEKYQSYLFVLNSGKTVTGLILKETPETVEVIENPLAKSKPVVLKKSDIEERSKSKISIMPKGLLDKLTRDEILDLVAYVAARGNNKHPFFHAGGHGDKKKGTSGGGHHH